jgi:hypothetical protein
LERQLQAFDLFRGRILAQIARPGPISGNRSPVIPLEVGTGSTGGDIQNREQHEIKILPVAKIRVSQTTLLLKSGSLEATV